MESFLATLMLGSMALAQVTITSVKTEQMAETQPMVQSRPGQGDLPTLPLPPGGKSTLLGGAIQSVDPVRDSITLKVFGQRAMKVFFDERTLVYRDGKRIPVRNLRPEGHASVQTVLDGSNVYALSIHMLSHLPEGEYQGQVQKYNPATRELTVRAQLSREPVQLLVPMNTPIERVGESDASSEHLGTSDLVSGALVSVEFESGKDGRGVASQIAVLASPGGALEIDGKLLSLDMHSGWLVLLSSQDDKSHQVLFDPTHFPISNTLHVGDHMNVTAKFDGKHYIASAMSLN